MRNKTIFRGIVGVLFVGAMFASCVQDDIYDDFFDEDLSAGSIICRRKFKADNNSNQSNKKKKDEIPAWTPEGQKEAEEWVYNSGSAGMGECVPSVISGMTGKSLVEVRKDIGPTITGASEHWEYYYYHRAKKSDGFPIGTDGAASLIKSKCGVSESNRSSLLAEARSKAPRWDPTSPRVYDAPYNTIVVQTNGNHWGILSRIDDVDSNNPVIHIVAYGQDESYYFDNITTVLRK